MRKAKATTGNAKKALGPPARKRAAAATRSRTRHAPAARPRKPSTPPATTPPAEAVLARAQADVVAAKFQGEEATPRPRPTLPSSYGESHLLLLPRDPQTLFATWDLSPALIDGLKSRLGSRGFAVSTLTLRLSSESGEAVVFHVGRKARSRYLKVTGGSSFTAEIGFTTPTGRFESAARSAACFLPMGPARGAFVASPAPAPAVASYRAAPAVARAAAAVTPTPAATPAPTPAATSAGRVSPAAKGTTESRAGAATTTPREAAVVVPFRAPSTPRAIGGASDLYRR
jgi:hypothetical protein